MAKIETTGWNATDHLDCDAAILAYLEVVFENGDSTLVVAALADIATVRGIAEPPTLRAI